MRVDTDDQVFASLAEVSSALDSLSDADHTKLMIAARSWWRHRSLQPRWAEPEDLLQDAVTLTLAGIRRWRKGSVSMVRHLDRTMESISGHLVAKGINHTRACDDLKVTDQVSTRPAAIPDRVAAREDLASVYDLFSDDREASRLVALRAAGKSASEIRAELGIGMTDYETICKRIRRTFAQSSRIQEIRDERARR